MAEVEQSGNHTEHPLVIRELAPPDPRHAPPFLETGEVVFDGNPLHRKRMVVRPLQNRNLSVALLFDRLLNRHLRVRGVRPRVAQTIRRLTSLCEGGFINGGEFGKQGIELKRRQAREGTKVAGLAAEFGKSDCNESLL